MALSLAVRSKGGGRVLPPTDVVALFSDGKVLPLPPAVVRDVQENLANAGFRWEDRETCAVPLKGQRSQTLFVIGVGTALESDAVRRGVAAAVQHAKAAGAQTVAVLIPEQFTLTSVDPGFELGRIFAEGALLANYRFAAYSSSMARREREHPLAQVILYVQGSLVRAASNGVRRSAVEVEGVILARNLVNEPSSRMTPAALVEQAEDIVRAARGTVDLQVWNREECERRGMGAFLAVARGSSVEPKFIHLVYRPERKEAPRRPERVGRTVTPRVALVGKGITFDSGGLSLKTAEGMETMKIDMAGAAAVLGVFSVLPRLKLGVEVHGFIAACENMPSGSAVKPGDIVRTASGKTVEILNTDAEGRLVLADALFEALSVKPHAMIDLATLTGACVVSLGEDVAGLFSNNDALAGAVENAATAAGEPVWRLPLVRTYRGQLKSDIADLKNVTGKRWGGAITAALFLQEFVREFPWAHLDIAGPSYAEKQTNPVIPVGGSGFGVRAILRYLEGLG